MNLIGLTIARNEDWVLELSMRAALKWVDELVVLDHASTDRTSLIISRLSGEKNYEGRIRFMHASNGDKWDEMKLRQDTLEIGRYFGGTHFAIIDADEVPTANLIPHLRDWVEMLGPGQVMDLPMIPIWGALDAYRNDHSVWSRAVVTTAFKDHDGLCWKPRDDGYQHHARPPKGSRPDRFMPISKNDGGIMHLQFVNKRRLLAKHVLYRMVDHLRWPERESVRQLNAKYDMALDEREVRVSTCPREWWGGYDQSLVKLDGVPWQEHKIKALIKEHGIDKFKGLDLKGFEYVKC